MLNLKIILVFCLTFIGLGVFIFIKTRVPEQVCFRGQCYKVSVAKTEKARAEGLSGRRKMSEDRGMLFVFDESGKHRFWMKGMNFPLDIIWLDKDKKIVAMQENAAPCTANCATLTPAKDSKYVLEVNAGEIKKINLSIGETIDFQRGLW